MTLLFYDWEVFKHDDCVVIVDPITRQKYEFVNADCDEFREFYYEHKKDIWIAYNGNEYDKYITQGKLCRLDLKKINDFIIVQGKRGYQFSDLFRCYPMLTFDIMARGEGGLKTLEAFMGNDIRETSVPFDINRKLTDAEMRDTLDYCTNDVEQAIEVFLRRKVEFDAQLALVKMFKKPLSYIGKSQAQLAAAILGASRTETYDEWKIRMPDTLILDKYKFVVDWFMNPINHNDKASLDCTIAGVPHTVAWGGIHGAIKKYNYECAPDELLVMADVSQLYPCLMLRYRLLSRGCPACAYTILRDTIDTSIRLKKEHKKKEREPYKRFNNIIYGAEGDKTNPMYDPLHRKLVCVFGQVLIIDLIEKVESFCELIQSNTDGVLFKIKRKDFDRLDDAVYEWEQRTGLSMTFDFFKKIYQGDVNNYLAVEFDGKYKSKGAYVKDLSDLDYDLPIVNKAIVQYLVNGVHPSRTVSECDDLIEFQKVVKVSSKYAFAVHCPTTQTLIKKDLFGNESTETTFEVKRLQDKTFRVFASTRPDDGFIGKCKKEDAKPEKFANTPEKCFIWNESVIGIKCPEYLDKQWYINLATNRIYEKFGLTV